MKRRGRDRTGCPIDYALDVFGDRWTLLVIRDLFFGRKRHFHELIGAPEGIATNILSARLRKLEAKGLISRSPDPHNRKQVIYELTEKGLDLAPILMEIILWSGKHDPETGAPKSFLERARNDREAFISELVAALRRREK